MPIRLLSAVLLLCALIAPVPAQYPAPIDEAEIIRRHLRVPDSTPVRLPQSPRLSTQQPRVFLAVGFDTTVRDFFRTAIDQWNRDQKGPARFIASAGTLSDANLVILRVELLDRAKTEVRTEIHTVSLTDSNGQTYQQAVPTTDTVTVVPTYGYVLQQTPDGLDVLARYVTMVPLGHDRGYEVLWEKLKTLVGPSDRRRRFPWW